MTSNDTAAGTSPQRPILIVGGSSGMGLALAEKLLAAQAEVIIAGRSSDHLKAAARQLGDSQSLRTVVTTIGLNSGCSRIALSSRPRSMHHCWRCRV